ncbi:type II secretion system F family protein [Acidisphaera sp. S103]|uniref:type II secretion system F family protein n=1 Tax=Acidisphaera sp. S103 TaxID=1747223 RepID=UPI00131EB7DB|nr:type II secretion system F family protein [Acidisphaera sp. S103]
MPAFRYSAITATGELVRGTTDAADEAAVILQLRRQGQVPARVEPAAPGFSIRDLLTMEFGRRRGLSRQEVTNITRELAIMLDAGQDMDRALRFLVETAPNPRVARVLDEIRQAVRDGSSLAAALTRHTGSFSRLYVGLVRAGEAGGTLAAILERLATLLERERALTATVQSAMIYPTLLMVAAIGSITLLLTEVLPQFVPLFEQNGVALPRPTQILIAVGAFVSQDGIYILLLLAALCVAARQALRMPAPRLLVDRWLLRLPVIGTLSRDIVAARFSRTLGTLVLNGVPLIGALAIVRDTVGNSAGVQAIDRATASAKGGAGLAGPLGESGVFPRRTIYLLRLGEETAQLGKMALRAAEIHEEKTRIGVQRLVSLLVPAITIVMGAAVAAIVSSLLLAMLSLNDLAN